MNRSYLNGLSLLPFFLYNLHKSNNACFAEYNFRVKINKNGMFSTYSSERRNKIDIFIEYCMLKIRIKSYLVL